MCSYCCRIPQQTRFYLDSVKQKLTHVSALPNYRTVRRIKRSFCWHCLIWSWLKKYIKHMTGRYGVFFTFYPQRNTQFCICRCFRGENELRRKRNINFFVLRSFHRTHNKEKSLPQKWDPHQPLFQFSLLSGHVFYFFSEEKLILWRCSVCISRNDTLQKCISVSEVAHAYKASFWNLWNLHRQKLYNLQGKGENTAAECSAWNSAPKMIP